MSQRFRELRESGNYSQEGIAHTAGVSQATWSSWERQPPGQFEALERLARHYDLFAVRNGSMLNRSNLRKLIVRIADRAGVRGASVHRFRHTFAVNFLRNGGNVFALQEILGHARIDTVKIYVKLAERDIAEAQRRASPVDNWQLR